MFSHASRGFIRMSCIFPHIPLYQRALASSTRSLLRLLISLSFVFIISVSSGVMRCLSCSLCNSMFFSSMAGVSIASLAVYQPSHLFSILIAVSLPARTIASQKLSYVISLLVSSRRYLLYSFFCSSFSVIARQSISPLCIDALGLYLIEVRFKVILTAR